MLVIWLLVLAVPAQAAAAATMAFCGPDHDIGGMVTPSWQVAAADHAHPGSADQTPQGHHSVAVQADEYAAAETAAAVPATLALADTHKCSACASCCSVSALFHTLPAVPAALIGAPVFVAAAPAVGPFATDGPDRPPRAILA